MKQTLCWSCSNPYDPTAPTCPRCGSINANYDFPAAVAQSNGVAKPSVPRRLRVLYEFLGTLLEEGGMDQEDEAVVLDGRETLAALIVERTKE